MGLFSENDIAITGMACKFPGATSVSQFWDLLARGSTQNQPVPSDRISFSSHWRTSSGPGLWGSFIDDVDSFDHMFFQRPSREAAAMDPQQRLLLEVAYQALESAGYFVNQKEKKKDVGCFVGSLSTDYNDNIASHPANAFSALGSLKAFSSGRISHYFGWEGPSITLDTACSSSGVAIDAACKSIRMGDCSSAIAGGVSIFTSPFIYQNLAAASFLSPEGTTKPFDAGADGYSRGEGVGFVVLKSAAAAHADGDQIHAIIASTKVRQSLAPQITVSSTQSQVSLYQQVLEQARVAPEDVTYVEAHGTGTRIGDVPEYEGIREVFGGSSRQNELHFASIKGNIGHAEGAAGIASLIKVVLMMHHRAIPPQAALTSLHPKIDLTGQRINIPRKLEPWDAEEMIACVNNFGAAGSITAMIVRSATTTTSDPVLLNMELPVFITANSLGSLQRYSRELLELVSSMSHSEAQASLVDFCFNLYRRTNRALPVRSLSVVSNANSFKNCLEVISNAKSLEEVQFQQAAASKPVVLVFCGQSGHRFHVPLHVYQSCATMRFYLDQFDTALQRVGEKGILHHILANQKLSDPVLSQMVQFGVQYAYAKTWIDCGLPVNCLIGHSLGQLITLAVAECLNLSDAILLIHGRASLVAEKWGNELGAMTSVSADTRTVEAILRKMSTSGTEHDLEIACYNAPKRQVLVGTEQEIKSLETALRSVTPPIEYKRLDVTHGFHSKLTDPILSDIQILAATLTLRAPKIRLETCSKVSRWDMPTSALLAEHCRKPVYFEAAIRRICDSFGACTWVEAGAGSPAMNMVRSALDVAEKADHDLFPIDIGENFGTSITGITTQLLSKGYDIHHWLFHPRETAKYRIMQLPPYQFEKTRHWLPFITNTPLETSGPTRRPVQSDPRALILSSCQGGDSGEAEILVNTRSEEWTTLVQGHRILGQPTCPASVYVSFAIQAVQLAFPTLAGNQIPQVNNLQLHFPLGLCEHDQVNLRFSRTGSPDRLEFKFVMRSSSAYVIVAIGTLHIVSEPKEALEEFARVGRLLNTLLRADPGLQAEYLKGSVIYRVLSQTVDYDEIYHVLTAVSWSKDIIYAEVCFKTEDRSVGTVFEKCIQSLTLDAFMQAAILQTACCHSPLSAEKILTCTGIGSVRFSPGFMPARVGDKWTIFATSTTVNQDRHEYDIFARDMKTNILTVIITGVQVCAVPTTLLSPSTVTRAPKNIIKSNLPQVVQHNAFNAGGAGKDTNLKLRDILERHIQLPSVMDESMRLSEIGVDSLLFIELCSDLERELGIQLPQHQVTIGSQLCEISRLIYSKMDLDAPQAQHTENGQNVCSRKDHTVQSCDIQGDSHPWLRHVLGSYVQLPSVLDESTRLSDLGVDSLIYIELSGDIEQTYGVQLSRHHITIGSQLREISRLLDQPALDIAAPVLSICEYGQTRSSDVNPAYIGSHSAPLLRSWKVPPQAAIIRTSQRFQDFAIECGCKDFWSLTNPAQAGLLQAYALETFEKLGSEIKSLDHGQEVRGVSVLPKYERLVKVLLDLLRTGGILDYTGHSYIRSDRCVDFSQSPAHLSDNLIHEFPQYTTDFQLLRVTASRMASILTGEDDPLHRLFGIPRSRALLEDLYINSPMFKVMSRLVSHFLGDVLSNANFDRPIRILEVGAGVGGTTIGLIESLQQTGVPFFYTFSDLSPSLVASSHHKFAKYSNFMEFCVVDIESPPSEMFGSYDIILSTLCIHATRDLTKSLLQINNLLQPNGFVVLAEFTQRLPWLDLVFGLLDGWWLFDDGRSAALAPSYFWERSMTNAGFKQILTTGGCSQESQTASIIAGFKQDQQVDIPKKRSVKLSDLESEVIAFKHDRDVNLQAEIFYPVDVLLQEDRKWPVALLIHGGGHVMFSRKNVPCKQVLWLLDHGVLPISVDYRLCPEVSIFDGPLTDVCDAYGWIQNSLPSLCLKYSNIQVNGASVGAIGWSSGGALAMSLGWTAKSRGFVLPKAVIVFYSPSDYEDEFWATPSPAGTENEGKALAHADPFEAIQSRPLTRYTIPAQTAEVESWLSTQDSRCRLYLHMVRNGQTLPVICGGIKSPMPKDPSESRYHLPQPPIEVIRNFSAYFRVTNGEYRIPTYFVHGIADSQIPWQQSQKTHNALVRQGIPTGIAVLAGERHLFDLESDPEGIKWKTYEAAYKFLLRFLHSLTHTGD